MVRAMDLSSPKPISPAPTNNKKTQDTDSQTPPPLRLPQPHPQPIESLSFTINGSLNRHQPPPKVVVSYKECLKNHAATIGGHALDGCGEFMPSPSAVPSDPTSLKCAACGCHRNFHRRHPDDYLYHPRHVSINNQLQLHLLHSPPPQPLRRNSSLSPSLSPGRSSSPGPNPTPTPSPTPSPQSPPPVSRLAPNYSTYFHSPPHMLLALSSSDRRGGGGLSRPSDELYQNLVMMNPTAPKSGAENVNARKRFRTKFSQEQKEKMCLFAEKLGWKMQRSEEKMVEEFCKEVGVRKGVLKVWMHNNKHTLGKRSSSLSSGSGLISRVNNVITVDNHHHDINAHEDTDDQKDDDDDDDDDEDRRKANFNFFANGSSSSS